MDPKTPAPQTIDQYIAPFPPEIRALLQEMRELIRKTAPQASEKISSPWTSPCPGT